MKRDKKFKGTHYCPECNSTNTISFANSSEAPTYCYDCDNVFYKACRINYCYYCGEKMPPSSAYRDGMGELRCHQECIDLLEDKKHNKEVQNLFKRYRKCKMLKER